CVSLILTPCVGTYKYLDVTYACVLQPAAIGTVACEGSNAHLICGKGKIHIVSANYGRQNTQVCSAGRPANQVLKTDCLNKSTISKMEQRCNGKDHVLHLWLNENLCGKQQDLRDVLHLNHDQMSFF
ncbi:hypothetical protein DPEC_G00193250, partial [Dallia pectoralis]